MAIAVDTSGTFYMIDDETLKTHGKIIPADALEGQVNLSARGADADVAGQEWPVCEWRAWINCTSGGPQPPGPHEG
jgi:hypothetical protein